VNHEDFDAQGGCQEWAIAAGVAAVIMVVAFALMIWFLNRALDVG
jgi:hypothetical protein